MCCFFSIKSIWGEWEWRCLRWTESMHKYVECRSRPSNVARGSIVANDIHRTHKRQTGEPIELGFRGWEDEKERPFIQWEIVGKETMPGSESTLTNFNSNQHVLFSNALDSMASRLHFILIQQRYRHTQIVVFFVGNFIFAYLICIFQVICFD